jgi:hypothetical protein
MAEGRKFSALANLRQQQDESADRSPASAAPTAPATVPQRAAAISKRAGQGTRGRPAGKRSDPAFEPTTVLLRKATKKAANRLLEDDEANRQDLSDLIEQLLLGWIKRQA